MKNIKFFTIIICIIVYMTSCWAGGVPESKRYVQVYIFTDSLELKASEKNIIWITCKGEDTKSLGGDVKMEIATKYGDTHYNKRILPGSNTAVDNVFTKVDIVSDTDFNSHPAGTSLASITRMLAASPYPYISRGYKGKYDWRNIPEGWEDYFTTISIPGEFSPINNIASNLSDKELAIIDPYFIYMRFLETPKIKTHTFTVTFYEGAKEYKGKLTMTFDDNKSESIM